MAPTAQKSYKRLILHIGTHKTWTTALQILLAKNDRVLAKNNILFPVSGRLSEHSGHHNIAWELNDEPRFSGDRGGLYCFAYEALIQTFANVFGSDYVHCEVYANPIHTHFLSVSGLS